jgi:sulfite reductase beta subunit-like hemoprotein
MRGLVSCTGAQFCGIAMIETKNRAMAIVAKLEEQLDLPKKVRMHWTGCPNSCGQVIPIAEATENFALICFVAIISTHAVS